MRVKVSRLASTVAGLALLVSASCFLPGCNAGNRAQDNEVSSGTFSAVSAPPEFTGPYANTLAEMYQKTQSEQARAILRKGEITDADLSEVQTAYRACLEELGFTEVETYRGGGGSYRQPNGVSDNEAFELDKKCSASTGLDEIEVLYDDMRANPDNEDWGEVYVRCLIETGVVDKNFTTADLDKMTTDMDPRLDAGGDARPCITDPRYYLATP